MIIVSGKLFIAAGQRETFLRSSHEAMLLARQTQGCHDFVVAADPIVPDRVNVYEEWDSEAELETFRGSGPDNTLTELIVRADVSQYQVVS